MIVACELGVRKYEQVAARCDLEKEMIAKYKQGIVNKMNLLKQKPKLDNDVPQDLPQYEENM
jgi:hypothetical protein